MRLEDQLKKMEGDWDSRARENARYFIATMKQEWSDEEFFASGEQTVREQLLNDMVNVCRGKDPKEMRVLEIGCGAGRITRALANLFGEVHGVDISGEMIERARESLRDVPNAFVYQNNGMDLSVVPEIPFDFAFSIFVFQHIPSHAVIETYLRDTNRLLVPGALFKFQAQGFSRLQGGDDNTWLGVPLTEERAKEMAARCDFELRYCVGAETELFWLWMFKKPCAER
jgi:cyclopropane fatty-acyl-phospholipid synthase-like methyltransferase